MSETGARLTIGTIMSIIWFAVLSNVTDWSAVVVFIVAVLLGSFMSLLDLILIGLVHLISGAID